MKRSAGATKVKIFRYLAFSVLLAMCASGAYAQDFDKGAESYTAGDFKAALKEFLPLAEGGDARAQYNLGVMYRNGEGVIQNYAETLKWYKLAAEQGHLSAQIGLGVMYRNGEIVIQNGVEAVKWFRLAADQGDAFAQFHLGAMYRDGIGVVQNDVMAHMWFNITSANGMSYAAKRRDETALKMTREEIAKAQAMAQECISSGYKNCGD